MTSANSATRDEFLPAPVRMIMPYFFLALSVFAVYGNVFDNGFVFDDDLLIQLNSYLTSWSHIGDIFMGSTTGGAHILGGFYRPIQILLYLIISRVFGGGIFWFHLLNILLHIANTCFVYRLGTKLGFNKWGVFLAALIWGFHTLHTEAVTYMSATADPLFAFFCLWAIIILVPEITQRKIFQIFPLFLLGLLSKETTAMFPLLVMACLFYVNPERLKIRTYFRTWPLWVVTIAYVIWRSQAKGFDGPQTYDRFYNLHTFSNLKFYADEPLCRLYTFLATLPVYLKLLLWPTGLHMERAFSIYTDVLRLPVFFGMLIVALMGFCIARSVKNPKQNLQLSWGFLWFAAAHAPDTGLLIPMNALFLEHWMYLPTVGLFLSISETITKALENRSRSLMIVCSVIGLSFAAMLGFKTYLQNEIWRTPATFYLNIFAYGEKSARSRNNLALYYTDQGEYKEALEQFNEAVTISDSYAETRYNMAIAYLSMPDRPSHINDAINCLQRALIIDPNFYRAYQLLGDIYGKMLHDKQTSDYYYKRAESFTSHLR